MNKVIEYISRKTNSALPDAFCEFMSSAYCGNCYLVRFVIDGEWRDDDVRIFKSDLDAFNEEFDEYYGRMNMALIPFGVGFGGDLYCLSLIKMSNGKVVRFSHDFLDSDENCDCFHDVIFPSIAEFSSALKPLA